MPNHFHLVVFVNAVVIDVDGIEVTKSLTWSITESLTPSETLSNTPKIRSLNDSIGIMLRTYARAIQKQGKMVGSLFQEHTKAVCLTKPEENNFSWYYEDYELQDNWMFDRKDYPVACFEYIHQNPVKAGLCADPVGWEFSSAPDYFANRNGKLINRERAKEFGVI